MTLPNPTANNSTEAYLAYKAGVLEVGDLKPSLYSPYLHFDAWLAYWCGLTDTYPLNKSNEPEMLTDEEALVAYLSGATDTYPEEMENPNDVRIVGYLRYLVSVKYGRPATPLTNSELYLSMMQPSIISNITPSADFVLDGTAKYPFIDLKMYGDTFQQTYSGKNLYSFGSMNQARYGIAFAGSGTRMLFNDTSTGNVFGQTYFNMNGTEYASANYASYDATTSGLTLPAGTYTISLHNFSGSFTSDYSVYVRVCKASSTVPNSTVTSIDLKTSATSATFTLAQETTVKVQFVLSFPSEGNMPTFNLYSFDIQIEQGSEATSFEPYTGGVPVPNPDSPQGINVVTGEQTVTVTDDGEEAESYTVNLGATELCKIGDYQDYIYKSGDDWYVHKKIGKVTLTGSESDWRIMVNTTAKTAFTHSVVGIESYTNSDAVPNLVSNRYTPKSYNGSWVKGNISRWASTSAMIVLVMQAGLTLDDFKTWLASNNTTVYYVLATPTDTKITDDALVGQLESIIAGGSYDGTTHVVVTASGENLPALLLVIAAKG